MAHSGKNKNDLDWLENLRIESIREPEEVPEGWKTMRQISAESELSESYCRSLVLKGVESGRVESRKFRIKTMGTRIMPVPHYRNVK